MLIRTLNDLTLDRFTLDKFTLNNMTLDKPPYTLVTGLLAEYLFENDTNDTSGNSRTATAYGTPTYAAGKVGNAISLNGTTQYARRDDLAAYFLNSFSVTSWVKSSSTKMIWHAQLESGGGATDTRVLCSFNATGKVEAYRVLNADYTDVATSAGTYNDNAWHFIAVTYDGATITLYTDGASATKASTKALEGAGYAFSIGAGISATGTASNFLGGLIDQMRIFNRALTAAEVSQYYNGGLGK